MFHAVRISTIIVAALFICASAHAQFRAKVQQEGYVTPYDFDFTEANEGIVHWEPFGPDPFTGEIPFQDDFSFDEDIVVAEFETGQVVMNDGEQVRYEHLFIGGEGNANPTSNVEPDLEGGTGVVRVEGFGTLFNNNPNAELPGALGALADSENWDVRGSDDYDVYVGYTGQGTLEVSAGGRMEIMDALIVALAEDSAGTVTVDGFSSHIAVGQVVDGLSSSSEGVSGMVVGAMGDGVARIRNGGKVDVRQGAAIGTINPDGSLEVSGGFGGSFEIEADRNRGPSGEVEVDGENSRWRIFGGLAVGMFDEDVGAYEPNWGTGLLTISDDALVTVDSIPDVAFVPGLPGNMVIGRFGEVRMDDGRLLVDENITNHGLVHGDGEITGGTFFNQESFGGGIIRVNEGERLYIRATGLTPQTDGRGGSFYGGSTGSIEVIGGEFDFDRLLEPFDPASPFLNAGYPAMVDDPMTPEDETSTGLNATIVVQDGTVRFRSGLTNAGSLAFTGGDNLLSGTVVNVGDIVATGDSDTTFDSSLINGGELLVGQDSTLTILGDLSLSVASTLALSITNSEPVSNLPQGYIATTGDITLGGLLDVDAPLGGNFDPEPGDSFLLMSTTGSITGIFDVLDFTGILPLSNAGWNWLLDNTGNELFLTVTDIMPIGADFNGDGIVDAGDLLIWQDNFGIDMGATGLQGDADGDGDVDLADYFIIQDQFGGPGMLGLAGGPEGAVPEPGTLAGLLLGLAAVAIARRRLR